MTRHILVLALGLMLGGCAVTSDDREIQHDPDGSDKPLPSPCVCNPVPYQAPAFQWIG